MPRRINFPTCVVEFAKDGVECYLSYVVVVAVDVAEDYLAYVLEVAVDVAGDYLANGFGGRCGCRGG